MHVFVRKKKLRIDRNKENYDLDANAIAITIEMPTPITLSPVGAPSILPIYVLRELL